MNSLLPYMTVRRTATAAAHCGPQRLDFRPLLPFATSSIDQPGAAVKSRDLMSTRGSRCKVSISAVIKCRGSAAVRDRRLGHARHSLDEWSPVATKRREICAFAQGVYGYPLSFLARPLDNPLLEKLIAHYRALSQNTPIDKNNSVREVLKRLKRGKDIGLLIDANTLESEGVFCDFFGAH